MEETELFEDYKVIEAICKLESKINVILIQQSRIMKELKIATWQKGEVE